MKTFFYEKANDQMVQSLAANQRNEYLTSWGHTIPARVLFTAATVESIVFSIFAGTKTFFGALETFLTWGMKKKNLSEGASDLLKHTNYVLISLFGAIISPTLAYKAKDENILSHTPLLLIPLLILSAFTGNRNTHIYWFPQNNDVGFGFTFKIAVERTTKIDSSIFVGSLK